MIPLSEDLDAAYTLEAYELNDPRKVGRRRWRRTIIEDRLSCLGRLDQSLSRIFESLAELRRRDDPLFYAVLEALSDLQLLASDSVKELARYAPIPIDAPERCNCPSAELRLPDGLRKQVIDVEAPETIRGTFIN